MQIINKMNKLIFFLSLVVTVGLFSCVDRAFDEPEFNFEDPNLEVTLNIAQLKSTHVNGQYETLSGGDIIAGVVVANDKSGNFYETIVIADETGGIEVKIDKRSLFNTYPVGRKVFVQLDGLVLGDYNDLIQIGYSSNDNAFIGIPGEYSDEYVKGGSLNNEIPNDTLELKDLDENYMSMLVTLKNVQFADEELGKTYADAQFKVTTNRSMVSCSGGEIIVRTSGYASFAGSSLPQGKGTFTAVLSRYRDDFQLYLRDTTDVHFDEMRCGAGTGNEAVINIIDLRNAYNSGNSSIAEEKKIEAVVISDRTHGNLHEFNAVMQDASGGIVLRFSGEHDLDQGDKVEVVVSSMEMSDYNGLLQISNLPLGAVTKVGNETPVVNEVNVSEILGNAEALESTLVLIKGASLSGGSTYADDINVTDGSGSIGLYTRFAADFADTNIPSGAVDVTAIVGDFNGPQLNLRSADDVVGGTVGPCEEKFNKDFEDLEISSGCWTTQVVLGDTDWEAYEFGGEKFGRITNFNGTSNTASDAWLISPAEDLSSYDEPVLTFRTACNYGGADLEIYISSDYDGESVPDLGDWTQITVPISAGEWAWLESGEVDLSAYQNESVHVAFRYQGSDSDGKTWEVDDIKIVEKGGGTGGTTDFEDGFENGLAAWSTYNVLGAQEWEHSTQYGNPGDCARVSGFDGSAFANEDWLISPAIDLSDAASAYLEFESAMNYNGNVMEVYLSDDYDGAGFPQVILIWVIILEEACILVLNSLHQIRNHLPGK